MKIKNGFDYGIEIIQGEESVYHAPCLFSVDERFIGDSDDYPPNTKFIHHKFINGEHLMYDAITGEYLGEVD